MQDLERSLSDAERGTRLIEAAKGGAVEEVRALLAAGADVAARVGVWGTALHWAALRGDAAVVRLLLSAASDPNARSQCGQTPLHWAAWSGQAEAAAALLQAGADRGVRANDGRTPLDVARQYNHQEIQQVASDSPRKRPAQSPRGNSQVGERRRMRAANPAEGRACADDVAGREQANSSSEVSRVVVPVVDVLQCKPVGEHMPWVIDHQSADLSERDTMSVELIAEAQAALAGGPEVETKF
ncbi:ankyrin repeat domain-containing protein 65-like [Schistocerca piceifrons]|uniref:ankyrin repeat domain-containing protein 65-like n=1 Tax=Schistocerca piceifrons TaxID=274613 RepID=UPI001F5EEB3A|nr:ankyrin repeat domain-containing protein 65-like [Schistocerca piceifrons]